MITKLTTHEDWVQLLALAEAGDNIAQYNVAFHYDFGLLIMGTEIVRQNQSLAFEWYYRAYKSGNIEAVTRTADFFSEGIHCKQDIEAAIELYQKGIDNGSSISANNLAIIHRDRQEYKKAFELHNIAQNLSKTNSLPLALCYHFGIGTDKNVKISFEIFNNISNDISELINSQYEIDEANYYLGKMYLEGEGIEKSVAKARIFLELANAEDDHRSAQELLLIIGKHK